MGAGGGVDFAGGVVGVSSVASGAVCEVAAGGMVVTGPEPELTGTLEIPELVPVGEPGEGLKELKFGADELLSALSVVMAAACLLLLPML